MRARPAWRRLCATTRRWRSYKNAAGANFSMPTSASLVSFRKLTLHRCLFWWGATSRNSIVANLKVVSRSRYCYSLRRLWPHWYFEQCWRARLLRWHASREAVHQIEAAQGHCEVELPSVRVRLQLLEPQELQNRWKSVHEELSQEERSAMYPEVVELMKIAMTIPLSMAWPTSWSLTLTVFATVDSTDLVSGPDGWSFVLGMLQ